MMFVNGKIWSREFNQMISKEAFTVSDEPPGVFSDLD
jgi:hypothetical protein